MFRLEEYPLELEKGKSETVYIPPVMKVGYRYVDELFEAFAFLRLGIDYDPLLATMVFQENPTEREKEYISMFHTLVSPLRRAWAWKVAQNYVDREFLEKEFMSTYEESQLFLMYQPDVPESLKRDLTIGMYLIGKAIGIEGRLELDFRGLEEKDVRIWKKYIDTMEEFVLKEPDVNLLLLLPEITYAPYRVEIKEEPYRHYSVRERGFRRV